MARRVIEISMMELRERSGYFFDKVHHRGDCIVITKRGRPHVAIMPVEGLRGYSRISARGSKRRHAS
ncbi:MAG: type II toxin-antitoxin system prevent-host-death family antitoxin [Candidatus Kerfeldbacteria bacterium]